MLKHGILGLLSYGSMTGYDVMLVFRDSLSFFWSANTSQIYRELQTLKSKGFVKEQLIEQNGKPNKKIFTITKAGHAELKRWLCSSDTGNSNSPLCMKTFFCAALSIDENIRRFTEQRAHALETLNRYAGLEAITDAYAKRVDHPQAKLYWTMTLDYGRRYHKMLFDWYDANIRILEAQKNEHPDC